MIAISGLLHGINLGVHGGLAIYFTTYYWRLPAEKLLWLGLLSGPAHPLAAVFAPVLAKRRGGVRPSLRWRGWWVRCRSPERSAIRRCQTKSSTP